MIHQDDDGATLDLTRVRLSLTQVLVLVATLLGGGGMWAVTLYQVTELRRDVAQMKQAMVFSVTRAEYVELEGRVRDLERTSIQHTQRLDSIERTR